MLDRKQHCAFLVCMLFGCMGMPKAISTHDSDFASELCKLKLRARSEFTVMLCGDLLILWSYGFVSMNG